MKKKTRLSEDETGNDILMSIFNRETKRGTDCRSDEHATLASDTYIKGNKRMGPTSGGGGANNRMTSIRSQSLDDVTPLDLGGITNTRVPDKEKGNFNSRKNKSRRK